MSELRRSSDVVQNLSISSPKRPKTEPNLGKCERSLVLLMMRLCMGPVCCGFQLWPLEGKHLEGMSWLRTCHHSGIPLSL
ncbi:RNA-dependent RNA polymerase [Corchorus olitorius]|uniref:RNA-dependent RNA polymerase n=1 Tax=Corchorus olitorius TaxID=93759 RepID=A0A1R3HSH3_9ROSI|nr:RNA-dependent RNA polymerase [Corchorus olitorius]